MATFKRLTNYNDIDGISLDQQALESIVKMTTSTTDIGSMALDNLPLEMLSKIVEELDLQSLANLRCTSKYVKAVIDSMPKKKLLHQHAPEAIKHAFAVKSAQFITYNQLYTALTDPNCAHCGEFGGHIYIITATRICYRCLTFKVELCALTAMETHRHFGLTAKQLTGIPYAADLRTAQSTDPNETRPGEPLYDNTAVRDLAVARESMNMDMTADDSELWTSVINSEDSEVGPFTMDIYNRNAATTRKTIALLFPWLERSTGILHHGFTCPVCEKYQTVGTVLKLYNDYTYVEHVVEEDGVFAEAGIDLDLEFFSDDEVEGVIKAPSGCTDDE